MNLKKILESLNELPGASSLIIDSEPGYYTLTAKVRLKDKDTVIQSMSLTFDKKDVDSKFESAALEAINDIKHHFSISANSNS